MSEKKVLIITYYWPPSGGSGVQRWLKFSKYLPSFGWTPYVFTPDKPAFEIKDESLLADVPSEAEVIHFPIWEPYNIFRTLTKLTGVKRSLKPTGLVKPSNRTFMDRIGGWIRANLLIPDPRKFWVRPSVQFLNDFIREQSIRTIITTGPPHSMHLIGKRLKKKNPSLFWIADFRDAWSEWGLLDSLGTGAFGRKIHRKMEKEVLETADLITTVTPFYVRQFHKLGGRRVKLFTNGYDEDDFKSFQSTQSDRFIIRHLGVVNDKCDPRPFFTALKEACKINLSLSKDLVVEFVGEVYEEVVRYVSDDDALKSHISFHSPVPHDEMIKMCSDSAVHLLILTGYKDAEGFLPGKVFEYIAMQRPVLGVGPVNGDAAMLFQETGMGTMIASEDKEGMIAKIINLYEGWKNNVTPVDTEQHTKFSRKKLTEELSTLFK